MVIKNIRINIVNTLITNDMKNLSITLVEVDNSEYPNIATITGATNDELREKATTAIQSHFDLLVQKVEIQDGLNFLDVRNSPPLDASVVMYDGSVFIIELQQTFIY